MPDKRMRLRYAGTCRGCGAVVGAGEQAVYVRTTRQVECLACHDGAPTSRDLRAESGPVALIPAETVQVDAGVAGASARREHERRIAARESRVRAAHPKIGGFLLAITDEPQSTRAWDVGARGEEKLAKQLDGLARQGALLLHDRRIRGTTANIDHIVISSAAVFVIDAKRYKGRPTLKVEGGILRARTETLMVGRRDCTKLVVGITKQVRLVRAALDQMPDTADVPVRGMLCFVDADWPLFGGSFTTNGIDVVWPGKASEKITAPGRLRPEQAESLHRHLASTFPVA